MACLAAPQCLCGLLWEQLACSRALDFSPGLGVQAPSLGCPGTTRSQGRKSRTKPLTRSGSPPLGLLFPVSQTTREATAEGREGGRGVHLQACARRPQGPHEGLGAIGAVSEFANRLYLQPIHCRDVWEGFTRWELLLPLPLELGGWGRPLVGSDGTKWSRAPGAPRQSCRAGSVFSPHPPPQGGSSP